MNSTKTKQKIYIHKKTTKYQESTILAAAETKSKTHDLIIQKDQLKIGKRPAYMQTLTRQDCTNIFKIRARMLAVKANFKGTAQNLTCRWCKEKNETQQHILTKCPYFNEITKETPYTTYFKDDSTSINIAKGILRKIEKEISET